MFGLAFSMRLAQPNDGQIIIQNITKENKKILLTIRRKVGKKVETPVVSSIKRVVHFVLGYK
jgi:hypothetical protein